MILRDFCQPRLSQAYLSNQSQAQLHQDRHCTGKYSSTVIRHRLLDQVYLHQLQKAMVFRILVLYYYSLASLQPRLHQKDLLILEVSLLVRVVVVQWEAMIALNKEVAYVDLHQGRLPHPKHLP